MKKILVASFIGFFAFVGVASAYTVNKDHFTVFVDRTDKWGFIDAEIQTDIYRFSDKEKGNTCYVAYYRTNHTPDFECVHDTEVE